MSFSSLIQVQLLPLNAGEMPQRQALVILQEAIWALHGPKNITILKGVRPPFAGDIAAQTVKKSLEIKDRFRIPLWSWEFTDSNLRQVVPAEDLRKASESAAATVRSKKAATYL